MKLHPLVRDLIHLSLREDLPAGDPTTAGLIKRDKEAKAVIFSRGAGIISGLNVAKTIFKTIDPRIHFRLLVKEGSRVKENTALAEIKGKARSLFKTERIALNFIQHLSGISTFTNRFVEITKGKSLKITDTRKTIPGLRCLEKYAVKIGGGENHRMHLGDFILIKDNHWNFLPRASLSSTLKKVKEIKPHSLLEVEVKNTSQLKKAIEAEADIIMLDNMNYPNLRKAVKLIKDWRRENRKKRPLIEISGGVNLANIRKLSLLGVERISIGALTHSAPAFPVDMEILDE